MGLLPTRDSALTLTEITARAGSTRYRVQSAVDRLGIEPVRIAGWVGLYDAAELPRILAEIERAGRRGKGRVAARCRAATPDASEEAADAQPR